MIKLLEKRNKKTKAMVFVDYESWFYSFKTLYALRPDPKGFRDELDAEFDVLDIMVFADFSSPGISEDLVNLRKITNTIIETGNTYNRHKKDMSDFIMLDYIYQCADENRKVDAYIIFTGDGHFQSVTKYLVQKKKKTVIVYGVKDAVSRQLAETASEIREIPKTDSIKKRCYKLIADNMLDIAGKHHIKPTFMSTAETLSQRYNIDLDMMRDALQDMLDMGYIYRESSEINGREIKVLVANWDKLLRDQLLCLRKYN